MDEEVYDGVVGGCGFFTCMVWLVLCSFPWMLLALLILLVLWLL